MSQITIKMILVAISGFAMFFLSYFFTTYSAYPHDAPSGWHYDYSCCNTVDCRPIDGPDDVVRHHKVQVVEVTGGYQINKPYGSPEFVEWNSKKIRESKDGKYHWCSTGGGSDVGGTICLYVPQRGV